MKPLHGLSITDLDRVRMLQRKWFNIQDRRELLNQVMATATKHALDMTITITLPPDPAENHPPPRPSTVIGGAITRRDQIRSFMEYLLRYEEFEIESDMRDLGVDPRELKRG